MVMANVPASEGEWTIRLHADDGDDGLYELETRCESWVIGGPAVLRFKRPEDAVSFLSSYAQVRDKTTAVSQLQQGLFVEATGSSEVWRPIIFALYHSAGPRWGFLRSPFHADGGPDSVVVLNDPEEVVPEGCEVLLAAHESTDPKTLVRLDGKEHQGQVVWHEVGWESNSLGYWSPFIKLKFEDRKTKKFELNAGPFRRIRDKVLLLPTRKGTLQLKDAEPEQVAPSQATQELGDD